MEDQTDSEQIGFQKQQIADSNETTINFIKKSPDVIFPQELEQYKPTAYIKTEVRGTPVEFLYYDFRDRDNRDTEPVSLFFDGYGQFPTFHKFHAAIIDKVKGHKGYLIIPRIPKIPPLTDGESPPGDKFDAGVDARIVYDGLKNNDFINECGKVDFTKGVYILGFSDGNRNAIEFARHIEKEFGLPQNNEERVLNLWSTLGMIDIVDSRDQANGLAFFTGTIKELTKVSLEEARLRYNKFPLTTSNKTINQETNRVESKLLGGFEGDIRDIKVISSILSLVNSKEGRMHIKKEFGEAGEENIQLILQLARRMLSVNPVHTFRHMAKNELRSDSANELSTFKVNLRFPRSDYVTPVDRIGKQLVKLAKKQGGSELLSWLTDGNPDTTDYASVGMRFFWGDRKKPQAPGEPELVRQQLEAAKLFFPKVKGVSLSLVGKRITTRENFTDNYVPQSVVDSILTGHLGPMSNPKRFLQGIDL